MRWVCQKTRMYSLLFRASNPCGIWRLASHDHPQAVLNKAYELWNHPNRSCIKEPTESSLINDLLSFISILSDQHGSTATLPGLRKNQSNQVDCLVSTFVLSAHPKQHIPSRTSGAEMPRTRSWRHWPGATAVSQSVSSTAEIPSEDRRYV